MTCQDIVNQALKTIKEFNLERTHTYITIDYDVEWVTRVIVSKASVFVSEAKYKFKNDS